MRNVLLIIDPNNDFTLPTGSLYVPGAEKTCQWLSDFIDSEAVDFSDIVISKDYHPKDHIAHPCFWKENPSPFSVITLDDVRYGKMNPVDSSLKEKVYKYMETVKTLTIWPEHCVIGTEGCHINSVLKEAVKRWDLRHPSPHQILKKGMYQLSEMHSIFSMADPNVNDQIPQEIIGFLGYLDVCDKVYIAGFAKDVCVALSVKDLRKREELRNKLVFMNSGMATLDEQAPLLDVFSEATENFGAIEY